MTGPALRIACVGEAMFELSSLTAPGRAAVGIAGDVLNTAIYLRRSLPPPHEVAFVSVIGTDPLSDQMAAYIRSEGIDTATLCRDPSRHPGLYAITTDAAGERAFIYWRDRSAARLLFQAEGGPSFAALDGFDVVYLSGITLAILPVHIRAALIGWIDAFRRKGGRLVFDSNYRPRLWEDRETAARATQAVWQRCDIALPSADDEVALHGDADAAAVLQRLRGLGLKVGALKRGAEGPIALDPAETGGIEFPPAARVVDTTAAGDSFNAGFLAAHLLGRALSDCLREGHALASMVVGHRGAILPRDGP